MYRVVGARMSACALKSSLAMAPFTPAVLARGFARGAGRDRCTRICRRGTEREVAVREDGVGAEDGRPGEENIRG